MSRRPPRVLLVTRPTELERLVARHGTLGQARFFLRARGQDVEPLREAHARQTEALAHARRVVPAEWRSARLERAELSRFVYEPDDLVVAIGQDGLVANVAKYLEGQRVIGLNPDPERVPGVLVPHAPARLEDLLLACAADAVLLEERTMVEARTDDGQVLRALNEIFVGHASHQSARYQLRLGDADERHSSSGLIVCTGTGSTGWARSIARERRVEWSLPAPTDPALAFFVREAWPSLTTGTDLTAGRLDRAAALEVRSEMNDGGVVFGDGIEEDRVAFGFGVRVRVAPAARRLRVVLAPRGG